MQRVRRRNAYQHVSEFARGRIVVYWNCGLSYRNIATRVCRGPMTVYRIWIQWFQEGNMERRTGSQRTTITNNREDTHLIRIALMDYTAKSQALSHKIFKVISV